MTYKSKFEKTVAKTFQKQGIKFEYEAEVVPFVQPAKKRKYVPDWKITTSKGDVLFVETKGKFTLEDRQKLVWVKEQHPDKRIILLFMNASNKLRKNSKTTYGEWCDKNGFEFYDVRQGIPASWK